MRRDFCYQNRRLLQALNNKRIKSTGSEFLQVMLLINTMNSRSMVVDEELKDSP